MPSATKILKLVREDINEYGKDYTGNTYVMGQFNAALKIAHRISNMMREERKLTAKKAPKG